MPSHTISLNWTRSGESVTQNVTVTADGEHNLDVTVPGSTTDKQVDIALDVSELAAIYIHSDKDITIETNSGAAPADTLTIKANKPLVWYTDCGLANPLTTDVTALFITRGAAGDATVKLRFLEDVTP